ncbi:LLM class flavin-dependent oxidoreductase [Ancylobacter sp. A5.8]|uniref:LLM class flavin-dependent oxidoreductase n=1 Tax=Ancylobacter gelatini TaxID=2919920 RepID=UPI001F4E91B4|nr:LLM class flavin-dependent oxidoreductase [Ancylobacter gelatini]MCJ8141815.1 LLM class flavin-dependent oxidoreductase [Ancylobacter gelatini]
MKLGFFTMPIHPLHRPLTETLQEDREFCLIAEKLGFCEGYFGEHVTDGAETITSSLIFIAWLLNETKTIKLGSGTINLPNQHPARVAGEVAMLDHMAKGRYLMGISPGGLLSDAEVFGNLDKNRTEMFVEAIDHILAIWSGEPPYRREGKYWNITTERTHIPALGQGAMHKPYQTPHPPIVVTAVAPFSKGVAEAAQRGWDPISANFLLPCWVKTHWPKYVEGCEKGGRPADPANWRVAKSIFVADDLATAKRYATEPGSPYYAYYSSLATKLVGNGRANLFKHDQNAPDSSVTVDSVLSDLVIWGTPDKVADELAAFQDEIGEFGTLLYAGHDWADKQLAIRSLELMAEKVMPAVNAGRHSAAAE